LPLHFRSFFSFFYFFPSLSHRAFGVKAVAVKPIIATICSFFDHSDKTVRMEAQELVVELYKYLGPAINATIQNLRPAQVWCQEL
jgi:cytoskeleton-associated protein 5